VTPRRRVTGWTVAAVIVAVVVVGYKVVEHWTTPPSWAPILSTVLVHLMFVGETAFIALFAWTARGVDGRLPWWRTTWGRALMTISAGLWMLTGIPVLNRWTDYATPWPVAVAVFVTIIAGIYERLWALGKSALAERRARRG
jgi:hypothetical protein